MHYDDVMMKLNVSEFLSQFLLRQRDREPRETHATPAGTLKLTRVTTRVVIWCHGIMMRSQRIRKA